MNHFFGNRIHQGTARVMSLPFVTLRMNSEYLAKTCGKKNAERREEKDLPGIPRTVLGIEKTIET